MTQYVTSADGLNIAYESVGTGAPVVLVHGFASDRVQNWRAPGWYTVLADAGYRVVAMDCRGHGESDKPHEAKFYGHEAMADDVLRVLSAAEARGGHVMGYSMGGMIAIELAVNHAETFGKVVLGGVGSTYFAAPDSADATMTSPKVRSRIAAALVEPDKSRIADPVALGFRKFAEQAGKDLKALAACMSAERRNYMREDLSRVEEPVLVVCGEKDDRTGPPEGLAAAFANGRSVTIPRRDHMTTVGDKEYKRAVLEFLAG
jgi:pimeloyl-ACP methyl ester carboxylesterase